MDLDEKIEAYLVTLWLTITISDFGSISLTLLPFCSSPFMMCLSPSVYTLMIYIFHILGNVKQ